MNTGILLSILFIVVCLRVVDKRLLKKRGLFTKIHIPAGVAFVITGVLHIVTTYPLLPTQPVSVPATGMLGFFFILVCIFCGYRKKMKLHRAAALFAALFMVLHVALNLSGLAAYQSRVQVININNVDLSSIPDGVYIGECDVILVYAKVEVTVSDGSIVNISILEHRNGRGEPAEKVVDDILERQTIDVDTVSGATNSSKVIKKAVENALCNT